MQQSSRMMGKELLNDLKVEILLCIEKDIRRIEDQFDVNAYQVLYECMRKIETRCKSHIHTLLNDSDVDIKAISDDVAVRKFVWDTR
jgi:hypothetical protein